MHVTSELIRVPGQTNNESIDGVAIWQATPEGSRVFLHNLHGQLFHVKNFAIEVLEHVGRLGQIGLRIFRQFCRHSREVWPDKAVTVQGFDRIY